MTLERTLHSYLPTGADSTLTGILAGIAAYRSNVIPGKQMSGDNEKLDAGEIMQEKPPLLIMIF